ncbi:MULTISPECIES: peptidylprolyl isomerase [Symbiopectobacterium]|uniref:peptidylprolyl isomerase n=1 Tax=Symbiopectobacterium TaxID=801 RepID=UPI001A1EAAB4|nr:MULTISPECIES: peptidylprolyl isomerase [Symbiopectobacterium]MBG6247415.1 peptidylprolyl isomerase [Candidatus Symbiopectobacterium sp. PLON1]MBT9429585.1 peptidylprolyl isomerase [Candidatus Symbiopectobacterium endolongispinus]
MMDNLRAAANNVVLKIILGLIVASFVLTGVGDYLIGGSKDYAAKVNGQEIGRAQFEQAVQNERSRMQEQLGENFSVLAGNDGYMQQMRQQVLSQLIDEELIDQYARKLELNISDAQIKQAIFAVPAFHTNNQFDNEKYLDQVRRLGLTPDRYAELLRKQLATQQLIQGLGATQFSLPKEIDSLVAQAAQDRVVRTATIDVAAIAKTLNVTDEEVKGYYDSNKGRFIDPEAFKVSYLLLDAARVMDSVKITDADIAAFYEKNKQEFTQPERKRFSVIQLKTEADARAVLDELKNGADFAALAKEKSQDVVSRRNGGDLGWMDANATVDELQQANLTEKGQLSEPVKSSVGYLIVRLDDIQAAQVKPLSAVRDDIAVRAKREKALDEFFALQRKVSEAASNDNESLASAEEVAGQKSIETAWFSHDQVPAELNFPQVTQVILGGTLLGDNGAPGSKSDVIGVGVGVGVDGDRAIVLRITDHRAETPRPLDQVRDEIVQVLKVQKAQQQANLQAEKILVDLKQGKDDSLKAANLSFGAPDTLSSVSQGNVLAESVFALPVPQQDKVSYGVARDQEGNVVLVALDSVKPHAITDEQKAQFTSQVEQSAVTTLFDTLVSSLRTEATIKLGAAAQEQQPQ